MRDPIRKAFWCLLAGIVIITTAENATAQIQVTSANPNNASQGMVNFLVVVNGNGFKKGAKAQWFISGTTNPGGVTVNSTAFNSSGQVTANISVSATAYVGGFDIVVTNTDGRSGKGTELFSVNSSRQSSLCPAITPINPPVISPTSVMCSNSGCADTTFNSTGFVLTNTDGSVPPTVDNDSAAAVQQIVMPDGSTRVLAVGTTTSPNAGGGYQFGVALVRYNDDGSLDPAFGNGGIVTTFPPAGSSRPMDGVLDAQGNIVVLFELSSGAQVARFHPDGSLDTSFNGTGFSPLLSYLFPEALVLDQTGNIMAGGQYTPYVSRNRQAQYAAVFRLTPSGILDTSFGSGGIAVDTAFNSVSALAVETVNSTPYILFASGSQIVRMTSSGVLDSTFAGGSGLAGTNACGYGYSIRALRIDTSGNILADGYGPLVSGGTFKIMVARFTSAGNPDTSFGLNSTSGSGRTGFSVFDLFGSSNISDTEAVFTDGSGDFAIGGYANNYQFILKVDSSGNLIGSFDNSNGAVALNWGSGNNSTATLSNHGLLIEPSDGKLVVGGTAEFSSGHYTGYNFAVARVWP